MFDFTLPALGSDIEEGTLTDWLIAPGDTVERGQAVATVDTVKAAVDVEIWHPGTVHRLLVEPGAEVSVGTPLMTLTEPGEGAPDAEPARQPTQVTTAEPSTVERQHVTPAARREAAARGIDIATVTGTGPGAAVTVGDVVRAAPDGGPDLPTSGTTGDGSRDMRGAIAASMSRSKRQIPHYYLAEDISLRAAADWLDQENSGRPVTERILLAAMYLKAVALAAARFPDMNGFWRDGQFRPQTSVHVGVAISLRRGGLVAPAIHDTADKSLDQLMRELSDLVARARAGSMRSSEMSDPTLTVTNLGEQGVQSAYGVIYPPQVALVGFGKPTDRPWVVDGTVSVVPVVTATLAADHRASDGHRGALFLAEVRERLQKPHEL